MTNDEKDRHVVAAAVHGESPIIVTFNLVQPPPLPAGTFGAMGFCAMHPQSFLNEIFRQEEAVVLKKLEQQAYDRSRTLNQLLNILNTTVPEFVANVSAVIEA